MSDDVYPPSQVPAHELQPVRNFVLPVSAEAPHGAQVFLGLHIDKPGRYFAHGVRLEYRVGTKRYRTDFHDTIAVCTDETCAPPDR
jgi:hypothetical protein